MSSTKPTTALDLFGNERVLSATEKSTQLDLIDAAAERRALESGRPRSQEHAEILFGGDHA